jgi:hypothetical protein
MYVAAQTVTVSFNGAKYTGPVGSDGSFSVTLAASPASATPTTLTVSSTASPAVTLTDVLVGDVILCSGQSNAQLEVLATGGTLGPWWAWGNGHP